MSKPGQITMVVDQPYPMFNGAVEPPGELRPVRKRSLPLVATDLEPVSFRRWFENATIAKLRSTGSPGSHSQPRREISLLRRVLINNAFRSLDMVNVEPGPLRDRNWSNNLLHQTDPQDDAMPFLPETKETTPGETTQNRAKPTRKSIEGTNPTERRNHQD
jgi:hypothetical protein